MHRGQQGGIQALEEAHALRCDELRQICQERPLVAPLLLVLAVPGVSGSGRLSVSARAIRIPGERMPSMRLPRRAFIVALAAWPLAARAQAPSAAEASARYTKALDDFKSVLRQRRREIDAHQPLPNLPGQALYLARNAMISAYKDLTDAVPSKIGRPNKFTIPPASFEADTPPPTDESTALFSVMRAPPANAQNSNTPFDDVARLGTAIARAKGLDAATADVAGRISL